MQGYRECGAIREEIFKYIATYISKHVYPPSRKEIGDALGITGTTVNRHITAMIEDGILETDAEPGTQRAIRIANTQVVRRRRR